ncbi:MAG: hypothetical protein A2X94_05470 [Bdellovibrionales bacterium GWB1_55_8]|nr:MAG: hypothetical protein A2X94_05470 [Bdellovibrionales bacterium GWB1_55_8]
MTVLASAGAAKIRFAAAIVILLAVPGCATMSTPVLRHETGESLGTGRFRASARYETTRTFAAVSDEIVSAGVAEQSTGTFRGTLLGVQVAAGIHANADVQLAGFLTPTGGGWRVGTKYTVKRQGPLSIAAMMGYGALSSAGSQSYLTQAQPVEIQQTLSSTTLDFSSPVSYRFSPTLAAYSGLVLIRTAVSGSFGSMVVNTSQTDFGANLGFRLNIGRYEGDIEAAMMRVYDPFTDGYRLIPFLGLGASMVF